MKVHKADILRFFLTYLHVIHGLQTPKNFKICIYLAHFPQICTYTYMSNKQIFIFTNIWNNDNYNCGHTKAVEIFSNKSHTSIFYTMM